MYKISWVVDDIESDTDELDIITTYIRNYGYDQDFDTLVKKRHGKDIVIDFELLYNIIKEKHVGK